MHINMLNECMNAKSSETENIFVGMCATMFVGSDRYAMVVTEVITPTKIKIEHLPDNYEQFVNNTVNSDVEFMQPEFMLRYATLNKERTHFESIGKIYTYRKNKRWMMQGEGPWGTGSIHLGHAENYRDPSF